MIDYVSDAMVINYISIIKQVITLTPRNLTEKKNRYMNYVYNDLFGRHTVGRTYFLLGFAGECKINFQRCWIYIVDHILELSIQLYWFFIELIPQYEFFHTQWSFD